jgi:RHS repeat-associated protein
LTAKAIVKLGVRELDLVQEYTGHPYDQVLNLYYAKARMYDAQDRRFMAMDWAGSNIAYTQTFNQYAYVINNPLKYIDLNGLEPVLIEGLTIKVGDYTIKYVYIDSITGKVYVSFDSALEAWAGGSYWKDGSEYKVWSASSDSSLTSMLVISKSSDKITYHIDTYKNYEKTKVGKTETLPSYYNLIDIEYFKKIMCDIGRDKQYTINLPAYSSAAYISPYGTGTKAEVTSPYGYRSYSDYHIHSGWDLIKVNGNGTDPVYSIATGKVRTRNNPTDPVEGSYGRYIIVEYNDSSLGQFFVLYAHLSKVLVSENQYVAANQQIANQGDTGAKGSFHLHFQGSYTNSTSIANSFNILKYIYGIPMTQSGFANSDIFSLQYTKNKKGEIILNFERTVNFLKYFVKNGKGTSFTQGIDDDKKANEIITDLFNLFDWESTYSRYYV